jgi:hypothetical protein
MCHSKPLIYIGLTVLQNKKPLMLVCVIFLVLTHFEDIKWGCIRKAKTGRGGAGFGRFYSGAGRAGRGGAGRYIPLAGC